MLKTVSEFDMKEKKKYKKELNKIKDQRKMKQMKY
jgi:hypothetical protein